MTTTAAKNGKKNTETQTWHQEGMQTGFDGERRWNTLWRALMVGVKLMFVLSAPVCAQIHMWRCPMLFFPLQAGWLLHLLQLLCTWVQVWSLKGGLYMTAKYLHPALPNGRKPIWHTCKLLMVSWCNWCWDSHLTVPLLTLHSFGVSSNFHQGIKDWKISNFTLMIL